MTRDLRVALQRSFAIALVVLCFAVALVAQVPEWKSYNYPADGFTISLPAVPTAQKQDVPTDAGTFQNRTYLVEQGATALYVGVCDYGAAAANRDPDAMLLGAKNGAIKNTKAHIISENKITLGTYRGVQFEAENDTMHFAARIYIVGTTLYQTLVAYPIAGNKFKDTARFLDSFQLIARIRS